MLYYHVRQVETGRLIQTRPYTPEGFSQASQFAIIMAQAGVGPIQLVKETTLHDLVVIVTITGGE